MKNIKQTDLSMLINNLTLQDYQDRLKLLATSLFTWENLDKICANGANDFLELTLFNEGNACFIKDEKLGFMVLKVEPNSKVNIYNVPTKITAFSHEYRNTFDTEDVVIIKNNVMCRPTLSSIQLFAYRLYETETTIDVNLKAQKTPILIEGDVKTILTLENVYMKYSGNIPVIYGNKNFDIANRLNVLKTDAPYLIDKLELHKHEIWNESLTYLGIDNANTDKKERLISDEVESNNDLIKYYLNSYYKSRKKACDEINEKFLKDSDIKLNIKINGDFSFINNEKYDIMNSSEGDNNE